MTAADSALRNELIGLFETPVVSVASGTTLTRAAHRNRICRVSGAGPIYVPAGQFVAGDKIVIHADSGSVQIVGSGGMTLTVASGKRTTLHSAGAMGAITILTSNLANVAGLLQNL
jgi:hypothetical protein